MTNLQLIKNWEKLLLELKQYRNERPLTHENFEFVSGKIKQLEDCIYYLKKVNEVRL